MNKMIKTHDDIERIREGGAILASVMREISKMVKPGARTDDIDARAEMLIRKAGGRPAFLHYAPRGHTPFNSTICACINEEVVHAPAHPGRELKNGDIFSIDIGMEYKDRYSDMAETLPVGIVDKKTQHLMDVTRVSLEKAIQAIQPGRSLNVIGKTVQDYVEGEGYQIVRALVGHGVGYEVHEDPQVPNFDDPYARRITLKEGMVLAIEPMVTQTSPEVWVKNDGWTIVPQDGKKSAHFEHTIVVTGDGAEILTA